MLSKITPWEIKGKINYQKLIKKFGLQPLKEIPSFLQKNLLFRRKIIFAHRDFDQIIETLKNKEPWVMMTGLMPSGKFHFGHKLVADQIIFYQSLGAKIYLAIADLEAYLTRFYPLQKLKEIALQEYLINYLALGLKPKKCTTIYFQSEREKNSQKANAYYRLVGLFSRHLTFNEFKAVYGEITPGRIYSSLLQASDMFHPQLPEFENRPLPTLVPVGIDQDPHLRIARDMAKRIKIFKFRLISSTYHLFLPGLKGEKMSSRDPSSYIALTDPPEVAAEKIRKYAFSGGQPTLKEHREKGGCPEIDVSFQMLKYGLETRDQKLKEIYEEYKSGNLLTGELKEYLIEKLSHFLRRHQEKRKKAEKIVNKFIN